MELVMIYSVRAKVMSFNFVTVYIALEAKMQYFKFNIHKIALDTSVIHIIIARWWPTK